ncbi:MAG: DUF1211 domain-containing protein [Alphaproteobacteria bacterium]|nr:DUF1211 domain-containing protein [Alphaproteobacteria bacterium]
MTKNRLEAFSDGVIAIIITIMVLQMYPPAGGTLKSLLPVLPVFMSYVLSYIYVGIYWNNHHHMLQATHRVNGGVLWANLHLLFWLTLVPFTTHWMGLNHLAPVPVALYGAVLFMCGSAYYILAHVLIGLHGHDSQFGAAIGRDLKGIASMLIYAAAIPLSFISVWIALALYVTVAMMWLVPDKRFEKSF